MRPLAWAWAALAGGWLAGGGMMLHGQGVAWSAPMAKGVDEGEVLLGELNCVSCHVADTAAAARLASRGAPRLGADGLRLEPQWLRAWLMDPARSKPGTAMPHVLHGLPGDEVTRAADELTHYLVSIQPQRPALYLTADRARVETGRALYHSLGCVACHAPVDRPPDMPQDVFERARREGVPLGDLARKYPGGELAAFLKDPVKHRPGGRMPAMGLSDGEARAVATFLLRDQAPGLTDPNSKVATVPGVKWEYFEGGVSSVKQLDDGRKPVATGESDEITTSMRKREGEFAVRFTGAIEVPADGEYTFWVNSDDGSSLEIDGTKVLDNDGTHPPREVRGRVKLAKGPHSFELRFFQGGGGHELAVRWAGPGFDRQAIPGSVLRHYGQPMLPVGHADFAVDAGKASAGRARFEKLNCVACHAVADGAGALAARTARPLSELGGRTERGCLAERPPKDAPAFALSGSQRAALRRAVKGAAGLAKAPDAALKVALTSSRLGCLACHARDGVGGPSATGRDGWFQVVGEADLGEEGKLPPHLEKVGGKLRREWTSRLLDEGTKVRPYMATRMPVFGKANVGHLPEALEAADVAAAARPEPAVSDRDAKFGRKLVGRDGVSCIACHTFAQHGSLGIPALGLDRMHERLRWDWFRRYMPDPAALRPGTRMPSFWPEGKAANTEILGGDVEGQIRAIWAWLAGGAKADVPAGLQRSRQEIVVGNEAVIYRHFIEGAGSRAIGVGYPGQANLAFDANQLRLAMLWQGGFIDMARHSTDRGAGYEPPLGENVVRLPEGPAFARLPEPGAAWPKPAARDEAHRFLGYTLDAARRPSFRYRVGAGVEVLDTPLPKVVDVDVVLTRTLDVTGEAGGGWWFRAAVGDITSGPDGVFVVDGKARMKFTGTDGPPVVQGRELRVPVKVPGRLVQEVTW